MKKRIAAAFLAAALCLGMAGCGQTSSPVLDSTPSSSAAASSQPVVSESGAPVSSSLNDTEEQAYIELLIPALDKLGENNAVENFVLESPSDIEDTGAYMQTAKFTVGNRKLMAAYEIDKSNTIKLSSISDGEDASHYFYYPSLEQSAILREALQGTAFSFHLYDYKTDKEIDLDSALESATASSRDVVDEIISSCHYISLGDESDANEDELALKVSLDSSDFNELDDCAATFYTESLTFLAEYTALDPMPYSIVTFIIVVDNEKVGFMVVYTAPEAELVGTNAPIVYNEEYKMAFAEQYDNMMQSVDYKTLSGKSQ